LTSARLSSAFGPPLAGVATKIPVGPASPLRPLRRRWSVTTGAAKPGGGLAEDPNPMSRHGSDGAGAAAQPTLLDAPTSAGWQLSTEVLAEHPDEKGRPDGYWGRLHRQRKKNTQATAAPPTSRRQPEPMHAGIHLAAPAANLWLEISGINYGPFGRLQRRDGVLGSRCAARTARPDAPGGRGKACSCCRAHPLPSGCSDDPAEVLRVMRGVAPGRGHPSPS